MQPWGFSEYFQAGWPRETAPAPSPFPQQKHPVGAEGPCCSPGLRGFPAASPSLPAEEGLSTSFPHKQPTLRAGGSKHHPPSHPQCCACSDTPVLAVNSCSDRAQNAPGTANAASKYISESKAAEGKEISPVHLARLLFSCLPSQQL